MRLEDYAHRFPAIELQSTFYRLPRVSTAERWRKVAPSLVFMLKAFQGITHPADSPTWRSRGRSWRVSIPTEVGFLRISRFTKSVWEKTEQVASVLDARVIVLQLPPKYDYNAKNVSRLRDFLSAVSTKRTPAVEFRHESWFDRFQEARAAIAPWGGIIVTDPLKMDSPSQPFQYHRMHGSDGLVTYRHRYTTEELERLAEGVSGRRAYLFFNNLAMREDAEGFLRIVRQGWLGQNFMRYRD